MRPRASCVSLMESAIEWEGGWGGDLWTCAAQLCRLFCTMHGVGETVRRPPAKEPSSADSAWTHDRNPVLQILRSSHVLHRTLSLSGRRPVTSGWSYAVATTPLLRGLLRRQH